MKKKYFLLAGLIILLLALLGGIFYWGQQREASEQRRIELLETALIPRIAELNAHEWAEAIKTRNGAWQYALMDEELRSQYRKEFEDLNWVTGFSSPWVERYKVSKQSGDEKEAEFEIQFDWYDSSGYLYTNLATLRVKNFGDDSTKKWLITYLDFNYEPE